jgi:quaternary ammonium compound-resistance protein SugE
MSIGWTLLVIAGLLEVVWAVGLKYTESFTRLGTVLAGILFLGEPRDAGRLIALSAIIGGIIGLKLASPH